MRAHIRSASALASTVVVIMLTACGGSNGTTSSPSPTVIPQDRPSQACPSDARNPLTVASAHRTTWSACANDAGTVMYVYNISEAALLAYPYEFATLHRELAPLILSSGQDAALDTFSLLTDPEPDPQANGQVASVTAGWVYVAPQSYVEVTSPSRDYTGVHLQVDYYATVQYTMARTLSDYLLGKLTPKSLSLRNALVSCGKQFNITTEMVNNPPPPINIVQNLVRTSFSCYDAVKSLDPNAPEASALADDLASDAKGFAKDLSLKLPAEVWEEGFRLIGQLVHDR